MDSQQPPPKESQKIPALDKPADEVDKALGDVLVLICNASTRDRMFEMIVEYRRKRRGESRG